MMRKLVSLLAIVLMASPVVALGATYTDSFDNANPDQCWAFQDQTAGAQPNAGTELWHNLAGIQLNSPNYTVGFNGTANIDGAGIPPVSTYGLLSDSSFNPIVYAGSLTVSGILNADESTTATNDHGLIGFMGEADAVGTPGYGYPDGYLMMNSPGWRYVALYTMKNVGSANQQVIRLAIDEPYSGSPGSHPLMDDACDFTMQIETITPGGNIRISAYGIADHNNDGTDEISQLQFIVGVDTPDNNGHNPPGTYTAADVPKIYGGYTGFLGNVSEDLPTALDLSVDDFAAWDSKKGDFDLDGDVDVTDLGILATNYNLVTGATVFQGDSNYDGLVNVTDLGDLATNYATDVWAAAGAAVPEPATMTMLVLGALALLIRRRR